MSTADANPVQAPSQVSGAMNAIAPLVPSVPFGQPGPSGAASSGTNVRVDPGIAILDMYSNLPAQQGQDSQEIGLMPAARGKPRHIWNG